MVNKIRKFDTGATRSSDVGKIDYAHVSAIAERLFVEYMHEHRIQEDGKMREPDNYKKGMPTDSYLKSMQGHFQDLKILLEWGMVLEGEKSVTPFDALMAIRFNLDGLVHELMRGVPLERKYTQGKLKDTLNQRFWEQIK